VDNSADQSEYFRTPLLVFDQPGTRLSEVPSAPVEPRLHWHQRSHLVRAYVPIRSVTPDLCFAENIGLRRMKMSVWVPFLLFERECEPGLIGLLGMESGHQWFCLAGKKKSPVSSR
jgi:hypothetical protein